MAMEEEDIEKTAFHAGSSGLYEFTRMPFGLTNSHVFLQTHGNVYRRSTIRHVTVLSG